MDYDLHKFSKYLTSLTTLVLLVSCSAGSNVLMPSSNVVNYAAFNCPGSNNVSFPGVSGIRKVEYSATDVYITGVYVQYGGYHAFLYKGPILGGGKCNAFNYPSSNGITVTSTSLYGPDNSGDKVVAVGSYTTAEGRPNQQFGLLYVGAADGSTLDGYSTLDPSSIVTSGTVINVLGHSTMGGLVVGQYDTSLVTGKAFVYDISSNTYYDLTVPGGSASITAYGIWYNGGTSYTIAGGYSAVAANGTNTGFIMDWDSARHKVTQFAQLNYNNLTPAQVGTHFEGITTDGNGGYNLSADWQYIGVDGKTSPAFAHIPRNADGTFGIAKWTSFAYYPGSSWTSANTVYQNYILGLFQSGAQNLSYGYVATIP